MTEIRFAPVDGRNAIVIEGAIVTYIEEEKSGVSTRTGRPWKIRIVNIRFESDENSYSQYLRLKLGTDVCNSDAVRMLKVGDCVDVWVTFFVTSGNFAMQEVRVLHLDNQSFKTPQL